MTHRLRGALRAAVLLFALTVPAQVLAAPPRGLAVAESLDAPPLLDPALTPAAASLSLIVHLAVDAASFQGAGATDALARLDARLNLYARRGVPVVIDVRGWPAADADVDAWRQALRALALGAAGRAAGYQIGAADGTEPADRYAFIVKQASIAVRAADADAVVALGPVPAAGAEWLTGVFAQGIAPYVDAMVVSASRSAEAAGLHAGVDEVRAVMTREDPSAAVWIGPIELPEPASAAAPAFVGVALRSLGEVSLTIVQASPAGLRAALEAASRLPDLLSGELVTLDAPAMRWIAGGTDVSGRVEAKLLYSVSGGQTYLVYAASGGAPPAEATLTIDVSMTVPAVRDPMTGRVDRLPAGSPAGSLTVRLADRPLVLDFNYGQAGFSASAEARQDALPDVAEIVARHQRVQAAQDALVDHYEADLRVEMRFHPTPADPPYTVLTENRLFADRAGVEWAERSFSLNGARWPGPRPSFPLLQPEKVLSLPLELRLSNDYRYRLAGVERVGDREAYAVRFDPVDPNRALYRGTVWIDRRTFVRLKLTAVQTHGSGVVQANEEEHVFEPVGEIDGQPVWMVTHLTSRQTFLVAGRTLLNERDVRISGVQLNGAGFERARAEARAGDDIMYRDTDRGVRYLVKKGGTRAVSEDLTTSARAWAMGANIDPSLEYPLPIVGLDILDFDFLHRDLQLALLFGGVLALGNVQRAGLVGGRLDASVDFFGLALQTNDLVFDGSGEKTGERVQTRPASAGLNLGLRLTPSHKVGARLEVRHDAYARAADTADAFTAPSSTTTLGEGAFYEYRHRGYSVMAGMTAYRRSAWRAWGSEPLAFDPRTKRYTRYDVGVSKDFTVAPFQSIHLNAQYYGGARLDRFSMYQFGMFDAARMHGVPSAVRFSELGMFRGSYSFNIFDQYRLDLFVDQAVGRASGIDPDDRWRPVTGFGAAVNLRAFHGTIVKADIGHSLLPSFYRGAGSTVVQILVLKPL